MVFNHIHLWGYATPLCYVYALLILPASTPRWLYITAGFALGLLGDLFTNTPGLGAASLCTVGLLTPLLFNAFGPKDRDDDVLFPSARTMEWTGFANYTLAASLLYCSLFFAIEAFSFVYWKALLLRIVSSTLLTLIVILVMEAVRSSGERK